MVRIGGIVGTIVWMRAAVEVARSEILKLAQHIKYACGARVHAFKSHICDNSQTSRLNVRHSVHNF